MERVLIVEDDPVVQKALKRLFEEQGYSAEIRGDGEIGVGGISFRREAHRDAVNQRERQCFESTGVKTPVTISPNSGCLIRIWAITRLS